MPFATSKIKVVDCESKEGSEEDKEDGPATSDNLLSGIGRQSKKGLKRLKKRRKKNKKNK